MLDVGWRRVKMMLLRWMVGWLVVWSFRSGLRSGLVHARVGCGVVSVCVAVGFVAHPVRVVVLVSKQIFRPKGSPRLAEAIQSPARSRSDRYILGGVVVLVRSRSCGDSE
jgi:hypothetical protein